MINQDLVLAVNAGSSSLKVSLLLLSSSSSSLSESTTRLLTVHAERLLTDDATLRITWHPTTNEEESSGVEEFSQGQMDATQAMERFVETLQEKRPDWIDRIVAVGHRVVHGGTLFRDSVVVDDHVLHRIETVSHLAPLHNPSNLAGMRILRKILSADIPHVAVFDTSFHSTISEKAYTYPLPKEYRDAHMRKFGFHGTSVRYVVTKATQVLLERTNPNRHDDDDDFRIIVCHLGSGASVTAVVGNKSVDTSMGFTPLAGLMMGTRCGSVDPSLVGFAVESLGKTVEEVMMDFNKRSGLRGMVEEDRNDGTATGGVYDMRTLLQSQHDHVHAKLAVDMFLYRLAQHIASLLVSLGGPMDALVFTAGIGEHAAEIRERTLRELGPVLPTIDLDPERNVADGLRSNGVLTRDGAWPLVLDIATDEESMIAQECIRLTHVQ